MFISFSTFNTWHLTHVGNQLFLSLPLAPRWRIVNQTIETYEKTKRTDVPFFIRKYLSVT